MTNKEEEQSNNIIQANTLQKVMIQITKKKKEKKISMSHKCTERNMSKEISTPVE
jgi:hypothetical protein